jgi:cytochrome c-type biogenesis protein CcmF
VTKLKPENRFYPITKNFTTEASIHTNLLRDLYIVLGEGNLNDGWVVRIYYNPLVIWIWIGALIIFLGGIISMNSNIKKLKILSKTFLVISLFLLLFFH